MLMVLAKKNEWCFHPAWKLSLIANIGVSIPRPTMPKKWAIC
jgi:hypothetical protein